MWGSNFYVVFNFNLLRIIYPWIAVLTVNIDILYLFLRREDSASTACSVCSRFIVALLFKLLLYTWVKFPTAWQIVYYAATWSYFIPRKPTLALVHLKASIMWFEPNFPPKNVVKWNILKALTFRTKTKCCKVKRILLLRTFAGVLYTYIYI